MQKGTHYRQFTSLLILICPIDEQQITNYQFELLPSKEVESFVRFLFRNDDKGGSGIFVFL